MIANWSTSNARPPSSSPTSHAFFCGHSIREIPSGSAGLSPGSCRCLKGESAYSWTKFPPNSPSATSRSASSFWNDSKEVGDLLLTDEELSEQRQMLIGSYFLAEYSLESAALFNPSIVQHPDQSDLAPGALRFVLSLRATGEGHISSITFRTGIIHADHRIEVQTPSGSSPSRRQIPNPVYERALFERKLSELGLTNEFTRRL